MGNPLFNELIIGTGFKDAWSRSDARRTTRSSPTFALDPLIARVAQAAYRGASTSRRRRAPTCCRSSPTRRRSPRPASEPGPVADLLRLNIGVPPTPFASASRLGLLGGDPAGFPNGRRPFDDVTDIVLRVVVGGVLVARLRTSFPNNRLGDGVNVNDTPLAGAFPYVAPAQDGRNSRHVDPGEPGCAGGNCPID